MLPFRRSETEARDGIRAWYGRLWLAPSALKRRALTDTVRGVYLPYWTFDAQVEADWTAEAGHYYYETETYVVNGQTRTRQVQRIRWEPAAGHVSHFFDDDLVCASVGVQPALVRGIEPFPTHELKPYDAGYVAGWVVERYQIDLVGAAQRARAAMDAKLQALCAQQMPGDTYRNLVVARRLLEADVQAHPGAGLAPDLHVRRAALPVRDERRHRRRARRVSEESVEDRAARSRDLHHRRHRHVDGGKGLALMLAVIVTGVSRGLGEALAAELLARDCRVLGVGRTSSARLASDRYRFVSCDLSQAAELFALLEPGFRCDRGRTARRRVPVNNAAEDPDDQRVDLFKGFHAGKQLVAPDVVAHKVVDRLVLGPVEHGRTYSYAELSSRWHAVVGCAQSSFGQRAIPKTIAPPAAAACDSR